MRTSTKITAGIAGTALAVAAAGAAYAYWTTDGAGSTTATAAAENGSLVLTAVALTAVTPGTVDRPVAIKASNAGTTDLRVNSVATTITSDIAACSELLNTPAGPTFAAVTTSGVNVPAGTTAANAVTIGTGSFTWLNSATVNQNACKGAVFTLTFAGTSV
jgi:hypothetical protein